jgi:hypothetical protein
MFKFMVAGSLWLTAFGLLAALPARADDDPAPSAAAPAKTDSAMAAPAAQPQGMAEAPCPPPGHTVAVSTIEKVKHTRICYECKEVEYCQTRCAHTPILSTRCHEHGHCAGSCGCPPEAPSPECIRCGCVRTRKVLIKKFITEEVPVPACKVEHVPDVVPGHPACGDGVFPTGSMPAAAQPSTQR